MPKTKAQKISIIKNSTERLEKNKSLVIADFTGLSVNVMNSLRKTLKESGMKLEVIKKRLLKKVLESKQIDLDPKKLDGQTGVVFSEGDITETAQLVYKFEKANKDKFKMLSGIELASGKVWDEKEIGAIGRLPSREILLGQLVGMIAYPLKSFMWVLNEKSKK